MKLVRNGPLCDTITLEMRFFEFWNMEHILILHYIILFLSVFLRFLRSNGCSSSKAVRNRCSETITTSTTRVIQQLNPLLKSILGTHHLKTEDFLMVHRKRLVLSHETEWHCFSSDPMISLSITYNLYRSLMIFKKAVLRALR